MKTDVAVFVTDGINRRNEMLPLGVLVESMEAPLAQAIKWDLPYGMPVNIAHDYCRPLGWAEPRGVYLAKDMARQIGKFYLPDDQGDCEAIERVRAAFMQRHIGEQIEPYAQELQSRITGHSSAEARLSHVGAAIVIEPGLASQMFPDFFDNRSAHVDKDGLVDFGYLINRTRQIRPGVFHEPEHDLLLFAHSYYRRSLSRRNNLNSEILQSITQAAEIEGVYARLRLDPDMLGHPDSANDVMELEYWHGPKYDDDIACIPSGVAEHKSDAGGRQYSRIDKTQLWWKNPETRPSENGAREIRTFEVEELIEDESPGLNDDTYGCRYAHAEYDLGTRTISHFDGAIRAYVGDAYLERLDRRIDRAGRQAEYSKLFRFDGPMPVAMWKRVLTDWFRGNRLIPEYLGASEEDLAETRPPEPTMQKAELPVLSAFLCLEKSTATPPAQVILLADQTVEIAGQRVRIAEIGSGRIGAILGQWSSPDTTTIAAKDLRANLARICLPGDIPKNADWRGVAQQLATAVQEEARDGSLNRVALAISWTTQNVLTILSIEGDAALVGTALGDAALVVKPEVPASEWIERFREALLIHAPELTAPVEWPREAAERGRLTLDHANGVDCDIMLGRTLSEAINLSNNPSMPNDRNDGISS